VTTQLAKLPVEVLELAMRLGADAAYERASVHFTQTGRMRADNASRWMAFSARQTMSVIHCAFEWMARTGPLGRIFVRDTLENSEGKLSIKALGLIPIARIKPSPALTRG
jgi:hypothetical protein